MLLARDPKLDRQVAVKILSRELADASARGWFEQEAKALAALNHANIVTIFEIAEVDGQPLIAMEYLPGRSLRELLMHDPPTRNRLLEILADVVAAIAAAHDAGILHRDIKPENIVVGTAGVKVVDFGIARRLDRVSMPVVSKPVAAQATEIVDAFTRTLRFGPAASSDTVATTPPEITGMTHTVFGTPAYMAPEVLCGDDSSKASDVYSLGVLLHECLTGTRPHDAVNLHEVIACAIADDPPPRIDDPLGDLIARMLDRDPSRRPSLDEIARRLAPRAPTEGTRRRFPRWSMVALGGAAIAALLIGGYVLSRHDDTAAAPPVDAPPSYNHGRLAVGDLEIAEIPSYGAEPPNRHAFARLIAARVGDAGVDVIDPDELARLRPSTKTEDGWKTAARTAEADVLATTAVREAAGGLTATVTLVFLSSRTKPRHTEIRIDNVDVPALLSRVSSWIARAMRSDARVDGTANPVNANDMLDRGIREADQRHWSPARTYLEQAVHMNPSSAEGWRRLALVLARLGAPHDVTESAFEHALQLAPDGPRKQILHASLLRYHRRFADAIAALRPLEREHLDRSDHRDLLFELGESHWHDGHHDIAFGYFQRVLEEDPDYVDAAIHAGEYAIARRDGGRARLYLAQQHEKVEYADFAMGKYEQLAARNVEPFSSWAKMVLGEPLPSPPVPPDRASALEDAIASAIVEGDAPKAARMVDALLAHLKSRPFTGGTATLLAIAGEMTIAGGLAEPSRDVLAMLGARAPHYQYKRLSILAAPLVGKRDLSSGMPLTDRLTQLQAAIDAEMAGDRKRAVEGLTRLVKDPTFEWDFVERAALIRNLRALGDRRHAAAVCADTMRPPVIRRVFLVLRRICKH